MEDTGDDSKTRIFISYASADQSRVEEIYERLKNDGFDPFMDKKDILGGTDWNEGYANR